MTPTITKIKAAPRKSPPHRIQPRDAKDWALRGAGTLQILEARPLERYGWLIHGFSTRPGGESKLHAPGDKRKEAGKALNLGFTEWDSAKRVSGNRKRFFHALGADEMRAVTLRQIHSDIVHRVGAPTVPQEEAPQADALITSERGILLAIQTADCIPILLADTKRRAIAAVHSGWRGTLNRIAAKTLGRMRMEFGTKPEDVIAALGPGIGRCCYEVGHDVASEFQAQFPDAREWFDGPYDALAAGENDPNWLP